jgi:polysaccharide export outer membrane protein
MNQAVRMLVWAGLLVLLPPSSSAGQNSTEQARSAGAASRSTPKEYSLGPDDQIVVRAEDVEEFTSTPIRIDANGNINLPLLGRVHVAGLVTEQLENVLRNRLKKYLQDPQIFVTLVEFRSQPISVLGAVRTPGIHQLEGHKTLFEVLSLAGGLREDAGYSIKITRHLQWGRIPLPDAKDNDSGQFSIASVNVKSIMSATKPEDNIEIKPDDVISVPKADIVYVIGAVKKSGGYVLGENETLSALQVLSLAEGLDRAADAQNSKILRTKPGVTQRTELPVDVRKIMTGKGADVPLMAGDILFVPASAAKNATIRGLEAALQIGTGIAIYRR